MTVARAVYYRLQVQFGELIGEWGCEGKEASLPSADAITADAANARRSLTGNSYTLKHGSHSISASGHRCKQSSSVAPLVLGMPRSSLAKDYSLPQRNKGLCENMAAVGKVRGSPLVEVCATNADRLLPNYLGPRRSARRARVLQRLQQQGLKSKRNAARFVSTLLANLNSSCSERSSKGKPAV